MNKIVVYIGKPEAGKRTRTEELKKRTSLLDNFFIISPGQILRNAVLKKNPLGDKVKSYLDEGKLVPDEIISTIVIDAIKKVKKQGKDIILDGFPRTVYQAKELLKHLPDSTINLLVFDITDKEVLIRSKHRLYCPVCGTTYTDSKSINPPKRDNICDYCGTCVIKRPDDKREIVEKRLISYEKDTMPVIAFLAGKENVLPLIIPQPFSLSNDPYLERFFKELR